MNDMLRDKKSLDVTNVEKEKKNQSLEGMRRNESLKVGDISSELADKEKVPLPKMNEVKVRLNRVQKKRARNSDSDQEVASWEMKPVRRQRNVRNLRSINYRSLSQSISIIRLNGQEQMKKEEMKA